MIITNRSMSYYVNDILYDILWERWNRIMIIRMVSLYPGADSTPLIVCETVVDRPHQSISCITHTVYLRLTWCIIASIQQIVVLWFLPNVVFYGRMELSVDVLLLVAEVLPGGHDLLNIILHVEVAFTQIAVTQILLSRKIADT